VDSRVNVLARLGEAINERMLGQVRGDFNLGVADDVVVYVIVRNDYLTLALAQQLVDLLAVTI
jgi:hypothetical protein